MDPSTQAVPGYYVWEVPGKPIVVHLHLDVIDRLSAEVMRGFGAVPKRGAEVGGLLLGTTEKGVQTIVRVEDFEPIPCGYKRGPSYLFANEDRAVFDETCARWRPNVSRPAYAVGYFRSHTREGLALGTEDIELMTQYFPLASQIGLLIKPFATKVSIASFFVRERGLFPTSAPLEFPFRRRELTGEEAPPRRSMLERVPRRREVRGTATVASLPEERVADPVLTRSGPSITPRQPSKSRTGWVWIPLSFVFLLLGMALGFLIALSMGPRVATGSGQDLSLGLAVVKSGDSLNVKWNRDASAIQAAQGGTLEIREGNKMTPVILDKITLQSGGNIVYTNSLDAVHFQLKISPRTSLTIVETFDWHK